MMHPEDRTVVASILYQLEFHAADNQVLAYLEELFEEYFKVVATTMMQYAELNNRTKPTWKDVLLGIENLVSIDSLQEFITHEIQLEHDDGMQRKLLAVEEKSVEPNPKQPKLLDQTFSADETDKKIEIPGHLPPLPPQHSYLSTKVTCFN